MIQPTRKKRRRSADPGKAFLEEALQTAITAAKRAGDIILKNLGKISSRDIRAKQAFDFVTKVDTQSERIIIEKIKATFPSHSFLAEETMKWTETGDFRWIIDPLDGTTNYIHRYPAFSVSIALEYKREIILGVVFDPLKNELFHAVKGGGAFLNRKRIHVSRTGQLRNSLIATGFPFRKKEMIDLYLRAFKEVFSGVSDIRRAGSAALDLAYVAAGRFEGFFELGLAPWDIAAGSLLIREAGGAITDFGGGKKYLSTGNIVAGNKRVHAEILKIVRQVFQDIVRR
ncbi:MAG TPA: inositol monophosphatase family protein [Thermodesulfovibrionales bacterium]|nr:inositol monophosphatase family protein [Thermodesulfovibrionales bacterium]